MRPAPSASSDTTGASTVWRRRPRAPPPAAPDAAAAPGAAAAEGRGPQRWNHDLVLSLAGAKILQHVQEEHFEQSVLLGRDEEGHGFIIFGSDAYGTCRVVLLEAEQAICTKGMMAMAS